MSNQLNIQRITKQSTLLASSPVRRQLLPHRRTIHVALSSNDDDVGTSQQDEAKPGPRPSLADPVQTIEWGGSLPSPRRAALGGLAGLSIVLFGNMFGATSGLLSLDGGKTASALRLDVLFPVKGFKRCVDYENGYEFVYPAKWLADQQLYRRYAERVEKERSLDPPSPRQMRAQLRRNGVPEPAAGFGPAGGTGEDNISAIVAPIRPGFKLENMGTPSEAAERFLTTTVAPPGSEKIAKLVTASSRRDSHGELYYCMEFTVQVPGKFDRHNVAVYAARNGLLYTLNAQCASKNWDKYREQYLKAAESFTIIDSGAATPDFPDQL